MNDVKKVPGNPILVIEGAPAEQKYQELHANIS